LLAGLIVDLGPSPTARPTYLGAMNTLKIQFLMLIFAGSVNRSEQDAIAYLLAGGKPSAM
jgi:hypothetical protein